MLHDEKKNFEIPSNRHKDMLSGRFWIHTKKQKKTETSSHICALQVICETPPTSFHSVGSVKYDIYNDVYCEMALKVSDVYPYVK